MKRQIVSGFFIASALFCAGFSSAYATTLPPGNPFYFVQDGVRNLRRAFTWGPISKALLSARLVEERRGNIADVFVVGKDEDIIIVSLEAYAAEVSLFGRAAKGLTDDRVLNAALAMAFSGERILGTIGDSPLATSSGTVSDSVSVAKKALARSVSDIFESAGRGALRSRVNAIASRDMGNYSDLSALQALSFLELYASSGGMMSEIRLAKDDFAFSLAASVKSGSVSLDKVADQEGSLMMRMYALHEVRMRVGDAETKAILAAAESRVLMEMVSRRLMSAGVVRDAIAYVRAVHAAGALLGVGNNNDGAYFFEQASAFFANNVYDLAFQHAVFAQVTASESFLKRSVSRDALRFEIMALKKHYDALPPPQPTFIEKRIAAISDMIPRVPPAEALSAIREMKFVLALLHKSS